MPIRLLGWLCLMLVVVSACTPQQVDTPVPTQTLIPSTATPTATPIIPTKTPQNLPAPQDFILTPSPIPLSPIINAEGKFDVAVVEQTQIDLANNIGIPVEQLQLVAVETRLYYKVDCPTARLPIPPPLSAGLEVTWIANTQTHTYLTWSDGDMVWCVIDRLRGKFLTAIDPIAAELSALAIRRVSQQENVSSDEIRLIDAVPVQWQNNSLGCPKDGQVYNDTQIDGYRIVVGLGETSYVFHTDSVQLVPCDESSESN